MLLFGGDEANESTYTFLLKKKKERTLANLQLSAWDIKVMTVRSDYYDPGLSLTGFHVVISGQIRNPG